MRNKKNLIWLFLFGSLWGVSEVVAGGILFAHDIPHSSIFLTAWALLLLAAARGIVNKPGSSVVVGSVATLFKLLSASPFMCHLLGVFALGLAFDAAATLLLGKERKSIIRKALTGIMGAYGGCALFAITITYIVRYAYWVTGGWAKVANHILLTGSIAALAGAVLVPIGFIAGISIGAMAERRPRFAYTSTMAGGIFLWILGHIIRGPGF